MIHIFTITVDVGPVTSHLTAHTHYTLIFTINMYNPLVETSRLKTPHLKSITHPSQLTLALKITVSPISVCLADLTHRAIIKGVVSEADVAHIHGFVAVFCPTVVDRCVEAVVGDGTFHNCK